MEWKIKKQVDMSYEEAIEKVKIELKKEGFGVLTTIDVKAKLKEKLNVDFDNYIILGACNPLMAHKALSVERDIGVFLPCNVVIYDMGGNTFVTAINPGPTMSVVKNKDLDCVADEVEEKLKKVINRI
ncbi:ABC transporter ATP-binding protein [Candidatus Woesearchaeota archaeon CG10_big_fil_rev_8_21_14_0_10_34_8]|nr:MAG: ABC transporter ATP-binding protein [Candidatus Woesearchaeota archaeon CG10_big_fil_rev_8_21_14_0_10_34_8]